MIVDKLSSSNRSGMKALCVDEQNSVAALRSRRAMIVASTT